MKELVSVIIPIFENSEYLLRCLCSINRLSYKYTEIIIAGDEKPKTHIPFRYKFIKCTTYNYLAEVTHSLHGRYALFCSPTSVLCKDFFEEFTNVEASETSYYMMNIYIPSEENFVKYRWNRFSVYGKLYPANMIKEIVNFYENDITQPEFEMACLSIMPDYIEINSSLYETNPDILKKKPLFRTEDDNVELWLTQLGDLSRGDRMGYINTWLSEPSDSKLTFDQNIFKKIIMISKIFYSDKELIYSLVKNHLKRWYELIKNQRDSNAYDYFKSFFTDTSLSDELIEVLIAEIGLTKRQYDFLLRMNMEDYLFFYNKRTPSEN